jgi:hypothetical protein
MATDPLPTAKEVLFLHCPSMRDEYLGDNERIWRDGVIRAMMHYAQMIQDEQRNIVARHLNMRNVPKAKVEHG